MVLVRNNLTVVDAVVLRGEGGRAALALTPAMGGGRVLTFEFERAQLRECRSTTGGETEISDCIEHSFWFWAH